MYMLVITEINRIIFHTSVVTTTTKTFQVYIKQNSRKRLRFVSERYENKRRKKQLLYERNNRLFSSTKKKTKQIYIFYALNGSIFVSIVGNCHTLTKHCFIIENHYQKLKIQRQTTDTKKKRSMQSLLIGA